MEYETNAEVFSELSLKGAKFGPHPETWRLYRESPSSQDIGGV